MLKIFVVLLLLNLGFATTGSSTAWGQTHGAAKQISAYRLEQTHYILGTIVLTVCPTAIRMSSTGRLRFDLVSSAPEWKVSVFRQDDKVAMTMPLQQFDNVGLMPQFVQSSRARFVSNSAHPYTFKYFGFEAKRNASRFQRQEFLPIKGLAAPQVERIIFDAYRLPTNGGLLLRYVGTRDSRDFVTGIDERGHLETNLTTQKIKSVTVDQSFFDTPPNYRQVKNIQEVTVGQRGHQDTLDFENIFDRNNDFNKKRPGP